MANLKLKHIYKVYPNGVKAVNDFTMDIEDKEFIVFVGPSGCGKSTTLRMIAGIEEITAGELYIGDEYVNYVEPKNRDIAMVFQNYALYPHMTVYDNMAFGLQLHKVPKKEIDRRVREAAEILGITEYLDRKPKAMSGGQRQRVALGRAIVREPKVFLLDEPLSNLDAKLRTAMRSEICKLHRKLQTTFIYVTHDQTEAMTMGTRIVVMKDGFVQQIDTPRNLYRYPQNKFVAGFIGTPQMNFFWGTLKQIGDIVKVKIEGTDVEIDAPASYFIKVAKKYLDGQTKVILGLRPEHITSNLKEFEYRAKCKVTSVEELGVHSQVYADFNLNLDETSVADSKTKVILRAPAGSFYKYGEIIDVALDLSEIHIFDAKTEESVAPRIPEKVEFNVNVENNALVLNENRISLPSAIKLNDGQYEVSVPNSAVTSNGDIDAEIINIEDVNGTTLLTLKIGEQIMFATDLNGGEYKLGKIKIGLDLKQLSFRQNDKMVVESINAINALEGVMTKTKSHTKGVKWEYNLVIGDDLLPCTEHIAASILSGGGEKICGKPLAFEFTPNMARISDKGIKASIVRVLDYGNEKYAICKVGNREISVLLNTDVKDSVINMELELDEISVMDLTQKIKLV